MSSHREAPEISKDPVADNADVYAFVSPDRPDTVTIITNYVPLQAPAGRAELLRVRRRRPLLDLHRQRRRRAAGDHLPVPASTRSSRNPNTFLYNTGPITSLDDPNWNKRQFYTVTRVEGDDDDRDGARATEPARCPPCNIGPRSTPNYAALGDGRRAHARRAARWSSPGSATTRSSSTSGRSSTSATCGPFQNLHLIPTADALRRRCHEGAEHPHDRDPDADHAS